MAKITIKLEMPDGRYIEKRITQKQICALFDLQYMIEPESWETIELNGMSKNINSFFRLIEFIDSAMHDNKAYTFDSKTNKLIPIESSYLFGKPKWKKKN